MSEAILYLNNSSSFENNISFYDLPIEEHKKSFLMTKALR